MSTVCLRKQSLVLSCFFLQWKSTITLFFRFLSESPSFQLVHGVLNWDPQVPLVKLSDYDGIVFGELDHLASLGRAISQDMRCVLTRKILS